ncbi:MAG: hypothetical protein SXV54_17060 [Chloroflexota bacterium]|nr:hypothetical protein [Chloroflexota bacterium]
MLSDQLRQLAQDYITALQAQKQNPTSDELDAHTSETYNQFTAQLETDGIRYFDTEDATRIAAGILAGSYDMLYHRCGRAIVLDGEIFRIHGGRLAGHVIESCPECGKRLNAYDLYADPGGATRNLLRQAGLYPTADSLILMKDPEQHAIILQELREALSDLTTGDLLAIYAVVTAMINKD